MNRKKFDSLPKPAQDVIAKYSIRWIDDTYIRDLGQYNEELIAKFKADPKRTVTPPSASGHREPAAGLSEGHRRMDRKSPGNAELLSKARELLAGSGPSSVKAARTIVTGMANAFAVAGLSLLLILAVFTLLDGLLRAFANTPIDLVREIGDMIAAICGTCCLPIVLLHQNNIVLRIFDRILPPSGVRVIDTTQRW